jgi:hypothetical protein
LPGGVLGATHIGVVEALGTNAVDFTATLALSPGAAYAGNGNDLHLFQRVGRDWVERAHTFAASNSTLVVTGLTNGANFAIVQAPEVSLTITTTNGITLWFNTVAGWTHSVERTTDFVTWTNVAVIHATDNAVVTVTDTNAPNAHGFSRVRLELP